MVGSSGFYLRNAIKPFAINAEIISNILNIDCRRYRSYSILRPTVVSCPSATQGLDRFVFIKNSFIDIYFPYC